ncbi:GAF and ANTAR domain-containing protein [Leifsonia sp. NPDC102414]|uniref:GAF and ANTAR domain-containing protein n=1 Tax=Leifsonia sp. NPDC102414 TaxID=3364124 RepID=UPI0038033326
MSDDRGATVGDAGYCAPFLRALPVTGAAVSTIGDLVSPETVCATDDVAARLDELQFDLREGPCWEALATRRPVLTPDLRRAPGAGWPSFAHAAAGLPVASLFAFPLAIGPLNLGVIDLYSSQPVRLRDADTKRAAELAEDAGRLLLRDLLGRLDRKPDEDGDGGEFSRRRIHQATGAVIAQLGVTPEDAELVIRAHAFAHDMTMREVAEDILGWRLDFAAEGER